MFLTEEDYIVASKDALNVLQQSSKENRERAERMAIEEVSGYLHGAKRCGCDADLRRRLVPSFGMATGEDGR